ncbi:MAG: hypothetical protein DI556_05025 [Rhodovulum sulfidophilum]|uniref:DUF2628 domain-containing protein n=1 Tax=Rhodovulum sulfidophilum TaxID=35806 RepID=A0A2W5NDA3_RHOSU|nr:MAG: hypothetical protein DI556_05025 [Rhodovulum sulfidophilum]
MSGTLATDRGDRVSRLAAESIAEKAEVALLAPSLDESTCASWLWAFLLGPIYYAAHGFWGRALIVFALNFVFFIGIIGSPFLAYPAWKERAEEKARNMLMVDKLRARP